MIIKEKGTKCEHEGSTYIIGEPIIGTPKSVYDGLYGTIIEIHDGEDKDTENEAPDIYCRFEPPVHPFDIQRVEQRLSRLYGQKKELKDIGLDLVIMAPEMIEPIRVFEEGKRKLTVYILHEYWTEGEDSAAFATIFTDYRMARMELNRKLKASQENGILYKWEKRKHREIEVYEDHYEVYFDDSFCNDSYLLYINKDTVLLPDEAIESAGETYHERGWREHFATAVSKYKKAENLSEEQYRKLLSDKSIPERIHDKLRKKDSYGKAYWKSVFEAAEELLDEYLNRNKPSDCFQPEPDNPYPLCVGGGEEKCRRCCLYIDMESKGGE